MSDLLGVAMSVATVREIDLLRQTAGRRNAFELLRPVDPQGSVVQGDRGRIYDSARGQALPMSELGCKRPQAAQTAEDR